MKKIHSISGRALSDLAVSKRVRMLVAGGSALAMSVTGTIVVPTVPEYAAVASAETYHLTWSAPTVKGDVTTYTVVKTTFPTGSTYTLKGEPKGVTIDGSTGELTVTKDALDKGALKDTKWKVVVTVKGTPIEIDPPKVTAGDSQPQPIIPNVQDLLNGSSESQQAGVDLPLCIGATAGSAVPLLLFLPTALGMVNVDRMFGDFNANLQKAIGIFNPDIAALYDKWGATIRGGVLTLGFLGAVGLIAGVAVTQCQPGVALDYKDATTTADKDLTIDAPTGGVVVKKDSKFAFDATQADADVQASIAAGAITIDEATGAITVKSGALKENKTPYTIAVTLTPPKGDAVKLDVAVTVTAPAKP